MTPAELIMLPEEEKVTIVLEHICLVKNSPTKTNCIIALTNGVVLHIKDRSRQSMHDLISKTR